MLKKSWATLLVLLAFSLNLYADNHKDKDQGHNEDKSDFPHAKLELNLLKKKHYAPMPVELDASKSMAKKGNTLVMYEFDFGDGSAKKIVNTPIIKHTFEILGETFLDSLKFWNKKSDEKSFTITLRVQDNNGTWSAPKTKKIELKQIPDPGKKGKETLAGIDEDEDGVRDDVQLYIASQFNNDTPVVREALRQHAIMVQKNLLSANNKEQSIIDSYAMMKSAGCLRYLKIGYGFMDIGGDKDYSSKISNFMFNTKARILAEILADKNFSGQVWKLPSEEEEAHQCNFNESDL